MDYYYLCLSSTVITYAGFKAMNMLLAGIVANEIVIARFCRQQVLKELYLAKLTPLSFHLKSSEHSSQMVFTKNVFIEVFMYSKVML